MSGATGFRQALDETVALLYGCGADPSRLELERSAVTGAIVTVVFSSRANLESVAAADRARVEHRNRMIPLGHHEYSALYDRPGRRMLLVHRCFPHCPDWPGEAGS